MKNALAQTLDALGRAIAEGRHPPGATLPPEPMLGSTLGVSRTVVREAVKSLVAKGMLVTGPKLGTRVLPADHWNWFDPELVAWQGAAGLTRDFLLDLQELRRIVEPAAVRLAAQRADAQDLAGLEAAYAGMREAIEHGGDYVSHDLRFHQGLMQASHNRMLVQMSKALGALLRTSFEISTSHAPGPAQSLPLHRAVLDAVASRLPAQAERAIVELIDGAAEDIEHVLATRGDLPSLAMPPKPLVARGVLASASPRTTAPPLAETPP
jgi:DNA-binding FadR family transcriptional regulator